MSDRAESVKEFLARGGKIDVIPSGISSAPIPHTKNVDGQPRSLTKEERENARKASLRTYGKFNIRHAKIRKLVDGSFAYALMIASKRFGTFYSEKDFFDARKKAYDELGLKFDDGKR